MLDEKFDGYEAEIGSEESSSARAPDEALVTGAECLASLGHYSEARLQLDAALRLNPNNRRAEALSAAIHEAVVAPLVGEAASAFLSNELEKAEDLLLEVLAIDPEHGQASRILASVRSRNSMGSGAALYSSIQSTKATDSGRTETQTPWTHDSKPTPQHQRPDPQRDSGLAPILTPEALIAENGSVEQRALVRGAKSSKSAGAEEAGKQPSIALIASMVTISLCLFVVFLSKSPKSVRTASQSESIQDAPSVAATETDERASRSFGQAYVAALPQALSPTEPLIDSDLEPLDIGPKPAARTVAAEPSKGTNVKRQRAEPVEEAPNPAPINRAAPRAVEVAAEARAALSAGEWEVALDRAEELSDLAPRSSLLAQLSNEIISAAVTTASSARLVALSVGATEESTRFFADAVGLVRIGDSTAEKSAFMAARSYYVGADLFQRSAEAAQAAQIRATLDSYVDAHLNSNMQRLKDIWPSLAGEDLVEIKRSFRGGKHLEITVSGCSTQIGGPLAIATCQVAQTYKPRFGQKRKTATSVSFQLRREGANWQIETRKPAVS